ncbi:MAG: glycosyltransferase family 9 protein [Pyrinomonadaceae bacterium]
MDIENFLIFRIGHLGDTVVALPALWALRESFPDAKLTLLTNLDTRNPHYISPREVLPEKGLVDDWLTYPTNLGVVASAAGFLKLSFELRKRKFNGVIYLMPRIRTSAQIDRDIRYFNFSGIRKLFGAEYFKQNSLDAEIPKPTPIVDSEADFLLNLLASEGLIEKDTIPQTDLLLTDEEISTAREAFNGAATIGLTDRKLIAVAPGSKWDSKIWSESRYVEVMARLIREFGCYPIIFGGSEDREKGERLIAGWKTGLNAAGILNIRESAALLRDCQVYLGNDTGTMHLAAAVGTPCVAIFAAVDWKGRWLPFGDNNHIFRKTVECEGCHTADCFNKHKCLHLIEIDEVHEACTRVLATD